MFSAASCHSGGGNTFYGIDEIKQIIIKNKTLNELLKIKKKELEDLDKQLDVYKAKMESLLMSQAELIKEINKDD